MNSALELVEVSKFYPPATTALDRVSFSVPAGKVTALLGMNGAGKSTVVKLCAGVVNPSSGVILVNGAQADLSSPVDAESAGIGVVHQELPLLNDLTASENMALGRESRQGGGLLSSPRKSNLAHQYEELAQAFPGAPGARELVANLPLRQRQIVAIIRALWGQARYLLFDEPSTSLDQSSREALRETLRALTENGTGLLYVTHFLDEALAIAEHVVVLRDGRVALDEHASKIDLQTVIKAMTGQAPTPPRASAQTTSDVKRQDSFEVLREIERPTRPASSPKACLLGVDNFCSTSVGTPARPISLRCFSGEIVGFYGADDCGAEEFLQGIAGLITHQGTVSCLDRPVRHNARQRLLSGIVLVTGDRKEMLFADWSVRANFAITSLAKLSWWRRPTGIGSATATNILEKLRVKGASSGPARLLSGGNQQKVILGRFSLPGVRVCLAIDPTRGIDVAARREVHLLLKEIVAQDATMAIFSPDPTELVELADRVLVMSHGHVVDELAGEEITVGNLEALSLEAG